MLMRSSSSDGPESVSNGPALVRASSAMNELKTVEEQTIESKGLIDEMERALAKLETCVNELDAEIWDKEG